MKGLGGAMPSQRAVAAAEGGGGKPLTVSVGCGVWGVGSVCLYMGGAWVTCICYSSATVPPPLPLVPSYSFFLHHLTPSLHPVSSPLLFTPSPLLLGKPAGRPHYITGAEGSTLRRSKVGAATLLLKEGRRIDITYISNSAGIEGGC